VTFSEDVDPSAEQQSINNPPFDMDSDEDTDSDLEDAYDLREVSSDVEMHPDDLLSDARYCFRLSS
jgi:FK506-binding nuclear protein